ncbi:MAG: right-handed parallel beta-helix repeat-containing protein [Betaproteobacteria bacterium]|nr:MAG: right-handed parallel beta-helix repeat-containing protein [Betaproteobacteria bacterium]
MQAVPPVEHDASRCRKVSRRPTTARRAIAQAALILMVVGVAAAQGTEYNAGPETYASFLPKLQPGDILSLSSGDYGRGLRLRGLHGTSSAPIVIQGPRAGPAAVLLARPDANTVSLAETSYVTVRNFRIDGAHLPVDAIKAEGSSRPVHHITLEKLRIINYDNDQGAIAISTKCPAWGWIIRDNDIIGAGTGLYLGDSDGTAPFIDGLIENNLIVDTIGYNIEIKHQIERPDLPGTPTAPSVTILRHNVFAKSQNASVGRAARPNVLVGHFPPQGNGERDKYQIVGNIFFDNRTEALFQGEGNVTLARNLLFNPNGDAVTMQPHHDRPRHVSVVENLVAAAGRGIAIRGGDPTMEQEVARNEIYAGEPLRGGLQRDNKVGLFAQARTALAGWLVRSGARDDAIDRLRLESMTHRACELTADGMPGAHVPSSTTRGRHPLCNFLRTLSSVAR